MREPELSAADRRVLGSLKVRSWASVLLLGVLGASTMVLFSIQAREMESSAAVLSLSGRQRMLSQRAALLAAELERAQAPEEQKKLRTELLTVGQLIESTHAALSSGSLLGREGGLPTPIHGIYFEPPHRLDQQVKDFVVTLRAAADPKLDPALSSVGLRSLVGIGLQDRILPSLDAAVGAFEEFFRNRIVRLRRATRVTAALTLAALWFLGQLVLWPMIRDLRRHLSDLRRGEAEIHLTIENSPIGLGVFDAKERLLMANPALCAMLGYAASELRGRALADLVHPADYKRHGADVGRLLGGEIERLSIEQRFWRQSREVGYAQLHCGVLELGAGEPPRMIVHFVDRTEQHRAREEARRNQERLAHVTRLTAIGEMAAGLAHEINQPLTAIATYAEASKRMIARDGGDVNELLGVLGKVSTQAHRAGEVIQRLRLFMKKRRSREELNDINRIVAEAVELARADARFRDVPLQLALGPSLPRVVVDGVQIEQVILNLVRNAVDASLAVATREPVRIETSLAANDFVQVRITDRGEGLGGLDRERLFEAFYTTKDSGLGMGLTISRSIVNAFGGRLWCESTGEGEGATFCFSLPAAVGESTRGQTATAAST